MVSIVLSVTYLFQCRHEAAIAIGRRLGGTRAILGKRVPLLVVIVYSEFQMNLPFVLEKFGYNSFGLYSIGIRNCIATY